MSPEDEAALALFMGGKFDFSSTKENTTLDIGSIIMSKIKDKVWPFFLSSLFFK